MPVSSEFEAKNRLYLQKLQLRNQLKRQQQAAQEQSEAERVRREQNFNVCFSGANSQRTLQGARGRSSRRGGCAPDGGWRQWDERTVEIAGAGGQVFAVRPNGARRSSSLQAIATDSDDNGGIVTVAASPANDGEAPLGMFNATQRELHDLLAELDGLPSEPEQDEAEAMNQEPHETVSSVADTGKDTHADGASPDQDANSSAMTPPLSSSALLEEAAEALGMSSPSKVCPSSPTGEEMARRIQKLSACRRRALLAQLQAAEEADAAEAAVAVVAATMEEMPSNGAAMEATTKVAAAATAL